MGECPEAHIQDEHQFLSVSQWDEAFCGKWVVLKLEDNSVRKKKRKIRIYSASIELRLRFSFLLYSLKILRH